MCYVSIRLYRKKRVSQIFEQAGSTRVVEALPRAWALQGRLVALTIDRPRSCYARACH